MKYAMLCAIVMLWLNACSVFKDPQAGASATGNTGKISGVVQEAAILARSTKVASVSSYADVLLYREDSAEGLVDSVRTDSTGVFVFDSLASGTYHIEAVAANSDTASLSGLALADAQTLDVMLQLVSGNSSIDSSSPTSLTLPIILRDFQATHPDFENFDDRAAYISASPYPRTGYTAFTASCFDKENPSTDPVNWACEDGFPCSQRAQSVYGSYRINSYENVFTNTFRHKALALAGLPIGTQVGRCSTGITPCFEWEDSVYITSGMVSPTIQRTVESDPYTWIPTRANIRCHNEHFAEWWTDDASINKTVSSQLVLQRMAGTNHYVYDSQEFFPLDDMDSLTFGKNDLNIWCPPYDSLPTEFTSTLPQATMFSWEGGVNESQQPDYCQSLLDNGGERNLGATAAVIAQYPQASALVRNHFFTMVGILNFQYDPNDSIYLSGDDDIWVFIDGKLVVDLGGTHLPAEGHVVLSDLATANDWALQSTHTVHLFVADRQSDGSNLSLDFNFAHPVVGK